MLFRSVTQSVFEHVFHDLPSGDVLEQERLSSSPVSKTPFIRQTLIWRAQSVLEELTVFENSDFTPSFRAPFQVAYLFEDRSTPAVINRPFGTWGGVDLVFVFEDSFLPVKVQVTPSRKNIPNTYKGVIQPDMLYVGWRPGKYRVLYHGIDFWGSSAPYVDYKKKVERLGEQFDERLRQVRPKQLSRDAVTDPTHLMRQPRPRLNSELFEELQETFLSSSVSKYLIPFGSQFPPES